MAMNRKLAVAATLASGPLGVLFVKVVIWTGTGAWQALPTDGTVFAAFLSMAIVGSLCGVLAIEGING